MRPIDRTKLDDSKAFYTELLNESDRSLAVLGAAKLDVQLFLILKAFFVDDEKLTASVLDRSPFARKIDLAYCLGLLPEMDFKTLQAIRNIRNLFAHELQGLSFNDSAVVKECQNIPNSSLDTAATPRDTYLTAVYCTSELLAIKIETLMRGLIPRCKVPSPQDFP